MSISRSGNNRADAGGAVAGPGGAGSRLRDAQGVPSLQRSRRAQFSYEFLILISFFLIIFAGVMLIATQRSGEISREQSQNAAADIVNIMTREIRYAYIAGEGYDRVFVIPHTLVGVNYSILVVNLTAESAQGLQAGGPQAALLFINASTLPAPAMMSLPYKVELRYVNRDDASLSHSGFRVVLEVPLWTRP